jgi:hypothetical protein
MGCPQARRIEAQPLEQTIPRCVNHPDTETRVSCSACDAPICIRCMRQSAVGQKCPDCARLPRGARARGKPVHYIKATAAGLAVALIGGYLLWALRVSIGFGAILLPALLGFGVGKAVGWGAQRQSQQPFAGMAVGFAVLGAGLFPLWAAGLPWLLGRPFSLLGIVAAGYFALRGLRS